MKVTNELVTEQIKNINASKNYFISIDFICNTYEENRMIKQNYPRPFDYLHFLRLAKIKLMYNELKNLVR